MRVLLDVSAVPAQPVGAGVYTIALARGLASTGAVQLHLTTRRGDTGRWEKIAPGAELHAVAPHHLAARLVWEQTSGSQVAASIAPDVWHGPHYTMPLRVRVPAVVTVHDLTFLDHPEWHERSKVVYFGRMIRAASKRAAVLVCVSEHTATRLRAVTGTTTPIVVAPHGVDHERFRPDGIPDVDADLLAMRGVAAPYVAFAGTIEPRKNVPAVVQAFARVAHAHPDLRLVVAGGDGWGSVAAREAIAASGVATRIVRTGYVDDDTLVALFRLASAVAYPSFEEGFGLPALEVLACGTPLVTSSGSALEEVVGDAALLVPPGDVERLAAALARVLDEPALAARLRAAGPVRAASFTWDESVRAHLDAYQRAQARTGV